jgi:hypothetical protein
LFFGRPAVQYDRLGVSISRSLHTPPPLGKSIHRGIVERHCIEQAPDSPPSVAQSDAHLRFFPANQIGPIALNLPKSGDSDQGITAAVLGFARRIIQPLYVAE